MKKIKYILSSAILTLFIFGCDDELQKAKQDTVPIGNTDNFSIATFALSSTGGTNEADETIYTYTVTLDKPLVDNVQISLVALDGSTATEHEDYDFVNTNILAYETTATLDIIIYNDDLVEDTEILNVGIIPGPAPQSSHSLSPLTVYPETTITIDNFESGELDVTMAWSVPGFTEGEGYGLADLILLITDAVDPYTDIIDGSDGGVAEHVTLGEDTPDGDYYVVADVYAMDDSDFDIDIDLTFDQGGVIQGAMIQSPMAMNSRIACNDYVVLATITKSGTSWGWATNNATLTNNGEPDASLAAPYIGTSTVVNDDWADYAVGDAVEIEAGAADNEFWIRSYTNPYISNTDTAYMIVTINDVCGNVTVIENEAFDYGCDAGTVRGTGTVDPTTMTVDLTLTFGLGGCGDYAGNNFTLQL